MTNSRNKLRRFHRDIFFPKWSEESLEQYKQELVSSGKLTFSIHALEKVVDYSFQYGKILLQYLLEFVRVSSHDRNSFFDISNVFEFYSVNEKVKKACFRYSLAGVPVDLILVVSSGGVVITVYVTNQGDTHSTLNENLYERKP